MQLDFSNILTKKSGYFYSFLGTSELRHLEQQVENHGTVLREPQLPLLAGGLEALLHARHLVTQKEIHLWLLLGR